MKNLFAFALIATIAGTSFAQRFDCEETFFKVGRSEESCRDFFVCMLNRRLDFFCDDGDIFDEERIECRRGDADTCEFAPDAKQNSPQPPAHSRLVEIVGDECENDFYRWSAHPDPTRCHEFFICLNYNLVRFECDPGFIFSEGERDCVRGSHETCERDGGTPFSKAIQLMRSLRKKNF